MTRDEIDNLKARLDIVEVIGRRVELKRCGTQFRGLCPFHKEKSPSFYVNPVKRFYHCYGCGAGGDTIKFVMSMEGCSFGDALNRLSRL